MIRHIALWGTMLAFGFVAGTGCMHDRAAPVRQTETPEFCWSKPEFTAGIKGLAFAGNVVDTLPDGLTRVAPRTPGMLTVVRPAPLCIKIANRPWSILNPTGGTLSLWIRSTSPYFSWGQIFMDQVGPEHSRLFALTIKPLEAGGVTDRNPAHYQKGLLVARVGSITLSYPITNAMTDWRHLAITWDKSKVALCIDGAEVRSHTNGFVVPDMESAPAFYLANTRQNYAAPGAPFSYDLDECMLFSTALPAGDIQALARQTDLSTHSNLVFYMPFEGDLQYQAVRHPVKPRAIEVRLPEEACRYFSMGDSIPVRIFFPALAALAGQYKIRVVLLDYNGQSGDERQVFSADRDVAVAGTGAVEAEFKLNPERCGRYFLRVTVTNAGGQEIVNKEYSLAVIVRLPAYESLRADMPLGGHPINGVYNKGMRDDAMRLGMKWNRMFQEESSWITIEYAPGKYYWDLTDKAVSNSLADHQEILFTIHGTPAWLYSDAQQKAVIEDLKEKTGNNLTADNVINQLGGTPPKEIHQLQAWDRFVRELVRRYKGRVKYWEIWNEPNGWCGDKDPAAVYVKLLKVAYQAIHEEDPDGKVVGFCGIPAMDWTKWVLEKGGGAYVDIVSLHNYNYSSPLSYARRRMIERANEVIIKDRGHKLPLWNTETGFGTPPMNWTTMRPISDREFIRQKGSAFENANGIVYVAEHRNACYEVQASFLELAAGIEQIILHGGCRLSYHIGYDHIPTEKGVAYAAMAKVLWEAPRSIRRVQMGMEDAAVILVQGRKGGNTAVVFAENNKPMVFPVPEDRTFKGMDFLGNPLAWRSNRRLLSIQAGMEPIYIFDVPDDFGAGNELLKIESNTAIQPDSPPEGTLSLVNPLDEPLAVGLIVSLPAGWKADLPHDIVLSPRERKTLPFALTTKALGRGVYPVHFTMDLKGTALTSIEQRYVCEGRNQPIIQALDPIRFDSTDTIWNSVAPAIVNTADRVAVGSNQWGGVQDLSFTVQSVWRMDDGLYFRINVTDDDCVTMPSGGVQPYGWDCVEMFVDFRHPENVRADPVRLTQGADQFFIIPSLTENMTPCRGSYDRLATAAVECHGKKTAAGYVIEGVIRPNKQSGFAVVPGAKLGFDVAVDDADVNSGSGRRKTQMVWKGKDDNWEDASQWGRFILVKGAEATPAGSSDGDGVMAGMTYKQWRAYQEALRNDASRVVYYSFEKGHGTLVQNDAGGPDAASYDAVMSNSNTTWITGRWPEKKGLTFDADSITAKSPYNITNKAFSVELWIRIKGDGSLATVQGTRNGTLMTVSGYLEGWRITLGETLGAQRMIMLQFGASKNADRFGVAYRLNDRVWHHVVGTWDGTTARLYIDGDKRAETHSCGPYMPTKWPLRIGYCSGAGTGSVAFDVDEVALYNRALPPEEIRAHRYLTTP